MDALVVQHSEFVLIGDSKRRTMHFVRRFAFPQNDQLDTFGSRTAAIAFADGHAEIRRWLSDETKVRNGQVGQRAPVTAQGKQDRYWISERTTARLDGNPLARR